MAAFNENNARTQAPQFLGYSRGGQDTNAFGKLFSGLGEAIGMAAETADMGIQENIKEDVYAAYDQTNQEFGVTDRQLFEQDPSKGLPNDIQQAGENLRRMNMAVQQGNLSDTHYWARMEAQVRQLRAKYPGYREQIDSMVSSVTGQTPANALRRQMMNDMENNRTSAQQEESQFRTYLQSNEEYGPPDMWEGYASGKYDKMKLRQHISNNKQRNQEIETSRTQAAAAKEARELSQLDTLDLANRDVASMVDTLFYNTATAVAGGQAGLMELVNRSQDPSSPGGKSVTPEEEQMINQTFANIKVGFESQLNAQMYKPFDPTVSQDSYATILSADQINQIKSKAMMQIQTMQDALTNKDFGLLTQKQRELESRKLQATMDVISSRSGDTLLRVSAMEKITGPELAQWMVMNNPSASAAYKHAVDAMFSDSIVSGTSLLEQIESAKTGGATDHTLYRDLFKQFTDGIITDKNSMEGATRLAQATFNDPSLKLLTGLKTPQDRMAVFNMMTSNAMTAKMQELGKNNPQVWEQYQGWSLRAFTYLFKSTADTVQDSVVSNPFVEITFDPKTNQFKQEFLGPATGQAGRSANLLDDAMNAMQTTQSSNAIAQINDALRRITPILQAQGLDTGEELAAAFEGMGINLQAQKQPDFWKGLGQAVMDAVGGKSTTDSLDSDVINRAFQKGTTKSGTSKGGSSTGTNPLGRQSSVFDFREGMSDVLTDEIGEDQLAGYAGDDTIERERQALALRIGTLSNPQGSPVVSDRMVVSRDVAEKLNASTEAPERLTGLLGFIGNLEAPLGYNQVYGRNKMAPLDQMTINQVLSYQRDRVRRGSPSSAVGRYQFIRPTLRGLVRELGLTGDELFTPELQDSLAVHLLKRRGLDKYLDGQISLEAFGNSLAREWASLPVLTGRKRGRSYYAGDGLNKSLTGVDEALEAIASLVPQ